MKVYTTAPMEDPRGARTTFPRPEAIGYDGAFSFARNPMSPAVRESPC